MNTNRLISPLIIIAFFSVMGLIATLTGNYFDCNSLTEEQYMKSQYYQDTKHPYDMGLKTCHDSQDILHQIGAIVPFIGIVLGIIGYVLHKKTKLQKGKADEQSKP